MKKYLFILGAVLLVGTLQAKQLPILSATLERAVAQQTLPFANERVKKMCQEWPTCTEWVNNKVEQNPSFQVLDVEVERWVNRWENERAVWGYHFYVQTQENGQTKAYLFKRGDKGYSYPAPVVIKKFPGHPIPGKPSEYIKPVYHAKYHEDYRSLCNSWPGCSTWTRSRGIIWANTSQYIYKWDAQGNAVWKRRLHIHVTGWYFAESFYFQAYQTQAGGDYIYQAPVQVKDFPIISDL